MKTRLPIPSWALRQAGSGDWRVAAEAHRRDVLEINWNRPGNRFAPRLGPPILPGPPLEWAKAQGWRLPWLGRFLDPSGTFLDAALVSEERFERTLRESGAVFFVPRQEYVLGAAELRKLDALYAARDGETGRPDRWGELVAELRDLRRAVEAGVEVEVEGRRLRSFSAFYDWAHGRFHALEDGYDAWIGDDR